MQYIQYTHWIHCKHTHGYIHTCMHTYILTLHTITLRYMALPHIKFHYIAFIQALHCITYITCTTCITNITHITYIHSITHRDITLHYITNITYIQNIIEHYIPLHYITQHYITLRYITLHYITLHYITLQYFTVLHACIHTYITTVTLHYTALHCITLRPHVHRYIGTYVHAYIRTYVHTLIEGSLEVKLPTIWTVEKQRWEESEETRSEERRCRCAKR